MCDPVTMTVIAIGSAAVGAYGQYQQGKTQQTMYNYEAKQGEADARAEAKAAIVEADMIRKRGAQAAAEANAEVAASGNQLASAGALAINREIYRGAEEDAYFALIGGKDRSQRLMASAQLDKMRGASAKQAGIFGAVTTLGQGAVDAYSGWKQAGSPTYIGNQKGPG
jgi:hypothetical protein